MDNLLPADLHAEPCTESCFRIVQRGFYDSSVRPVGLRSSGDLQPEHLNWPATEGMARYHLLWQRIPTPFVSVFNNLMRAYHWAQMLEQTQRAHTLDIVVIDTSNVAAGHLWNAHSIASFLNFPSDRVGFHEGEYLFWGPIAAERVLGVFPVGGGLATIPIHLGELCVPRTLILHLGLEDSDSVRQIIVEEISRHIRRPDDCRILQTLHALCWRRFDR